MAEGPDLCRFSDMPRQPDDVRSPEQSRHPAIRAGIYFFSMPNHMSHRHFEQHKPHPYRVVWPMLLERVVPH